MSLTLDQQRAAYAWKCASAVMNRARDEQERKEYKEYKALAKGAPALIMNSGLMPTLAFYNHKGGSARLLLKHLCDGLSQRLCPNSGPLNFAEFMRYLQKCDSQTYLRFTDEALEILKWIRQFVDAVDAGEQS